MTARRFVWLVIAAMLMATVAIVVAVVVFVRLDNTIDSAKAQQEAFNVESLRARSANCLQFERDHLRDVKQLRDTYAYIRQLEPSELGDPINRFVIGRLPETEAKARTDTAPGYCDNPGLGLPEPDPVVPCRPRVILAPGPRCPSK